MRQPDTTVLCRLCQLPAAHALSAADTGSLLDTALTDTAVCSVCDAVCALCELLPGAQALSVDRLQELLRAALPLKDSSTVISYLCRLPAALKVRRAKLVSAAQAAATPVLQSVSTVHTDAADEQQRVESPPSSGSCSRSSSPGSDGRLGRALSSSGSSSSSSPVSRRSRSSRSSSDCGSSRKGSSPTGRVRLGKLCKQLAGASMLQHEALEELLLPC